MDRAERWEKDRVVKKCGFDDIEKESGCMLALERRNLILEKLQEEKHVVVSELSRLYHVSEETIRRDLDKLETDGYAVKSYGGAVINENNCLDVPFKNRKDGNLAQKRKIAELAAEMVGDGERIMLDAGATSVLIAKAIKDRERLTVITNSIEILLELADVSGWTVISTGGMVREGNPALWGAEAEDTIRSYYADKAFITCDAFDRDHGAADADGLFAHIKGLMADSSRESILAVEHSQFDCAAFARIADARKLSAVLTDVRPSEEWADYFEALQIRCRYPGEEAERLKRYEKRLLGRK